MLKVLHIVQGSRYSSGQTNAYSIAKLAEKSTLQIYLTSVPGSLLDNNADKIKVKFYPLVLPKLLRQKHLKKISSIINEIQPDIIHSHDGTSGFYSRIYKKHNPAIKTIHTFHSVNLQHYQSVLLKNAVKTIEQYLAQFTDRFIFCCEEDAITAYQLNIANEEKSVIIPKGIDISLYANTKKNYGLLFVMGLDSKNFIVGSVTDFEESKSLKILIQTAYFIKQKFPLIKFVIAGEGHRQKFYMNYIRESGLEDTIFLTGAVENLHDYYSLFDVYINTVIHSGIPYSLLEAMASKNAIISGSLPAYKNILRNDDNALLINPLNSDELFEKLCLLYENHELRQKLSQNALIEATQFDEHEMVKKTEHLYREVIT